MNIEHHHGAGLAGPDPRTTAAPPDPGARRGAPPRLRWRIVDIVTAAVLGVAVGVVFVAWNLIGGAGYGFLDAFTPGLGGLFIGVWLLGGTLGGLIIRKPGAALFVEVLAAGVSAAVGNQWGISVLYSGLAQGLGAELVLAILLYRRFGLAAALATGAGAGVGAIILELFTSGNLAKSLEFNLIYGACVLLSGAVLAGLLGLGLTRALARTGALDRFAAGREARELV
ncbi:ECF transporter S component [Corynebacterium sphenisci]|uniref:ECF transporter S component n=1 Tax=Corynebacterium sphenisci TaxID=191493 RepID=UPI000A06F801|nr:ECF transporter S component [Corynebacterium sphenisci]